jgi:hypothetical protein
VNSSGSDPDQNPDQSGLTRLNYPELGGCLVGDPGLVPGVYRV